MVYINTENKLGEILKNHTEIVKENTEVQKMLIKALEDNNKKNLISTLVNTFLVLSIVFGFFLLIYLV